MKRALIAVGIVLLVAAGGVLAYVQLRPRPAPARGDPAIAVAVGVGALMRGEAHRLTPEQVTAILPLLRVLRDTDPNDTAASRALAEEITRVFTPEQRAELARLREEAQARRSSRVQGGGPATGRRRLGPGGSGLPAGPGGPGLGPGMPGAQAGPGTASGRSRAALRRRLLERVIRQLEDFG
jgi:hypothetical protein